MGARPKAPVIVQPEIPTPLPDPDPITATPQASPTAQRGNAGSRGPAALAASMGMNATNLTGPRGVAELPTETRRSSLLGL